MCKCANASCEPAPALTGTETGTPLFVVSLLLRLAQIIAAGIWHHWSIAGVIRTALERLDRAREEFEFMKGIQDRFDRIPLSEGSEEYLKIFAEDYDR